MQQRLLPNFLENKQNLAERDHLDQILEWLRKNDLPLAIKRSDKRITITHCNRAGCIFIYKCMVDAQRGKVIGIDDLIDPNLQLFFVGLGNNNQKAAAFAKRFMVNWPRN